MIPCAELTYIIGCIPTASSASLHMRLNMVGPLRGPITTNANTPELRMNPKRRQTALRKGIFYTPKDGILQTKRRHIAKPL